MTGQEEQKSKISNITKDDMPTSSVVSFASDEQAE
jgi:hypothetical protein